MANKIEHTCDYCAHYIMTGGMFRHLECLQADETPEYVEQAQKDNGRACSYWQAKMTINGRQTSIHDSSFR